MLLCKQLPTFRTQTAGRVNSCFIPDGIGLHRICLVVGDTYGTQLLSGNLLEDITINAFNKEQRLCSAVQLAQINALRGSDFAIKTSGTPGTSDYRTYLTIFFATPWVEPRAAGNALAWNLVPGTGLELAVEVADAVDTPVLEGYYEYGPLTGGMGAIEKWERQTLQVSGLANEHLIAKKDLIQSLHIFPNSQYVNKVKFTRNGLIIRDEITHLQNQVKLFNAKLAPDTTATPRFDLLLDHEDPQDLGLNAAGLDELTLKTWYSASTTGTMEMVKVQIGAPE